MLNFNKAKFTTAFSAKSKPPEDRFIEVAFAGRSNAGKSSSLNTLTGQKKLARTSSKPGRTQQINFFGIDDKRFLVDLPGYGYAAVSKSLKQEWQGLMEGFLRSRQSLRGVVIIMDIRHPLKENDIQMIEWCDERALPMHLVLTKADKLKKNKINQTLFSVQKSVSDIKTDISVQVFSSETRLGLPELKSKISNWMKA
ncbi:YihA family ribosome biogenesis GTP-binding protein [Thiospirochaeta perfilievii]|uniref:Probable GTP-binding protein EngB n=1 Tax=Thiospirochaeta perfilievii TaxID=252967 RepID=A0A5C1QA50_9SPIO|nr:ribosome biogenesis GTP-binding protein YihA/YsxC [Thiospirochaeta perfilievii]QEN04945.1 YihA family ribosome biogenesis GTP-binding protein [Thiospirochaeta perfilievii]